MAKSRKNGRINVGLSVDKRLWQYHALLQNMMKNHSLFDNIPVIVRSELMERALTEDINRMLGIAWARQRALGVEGDRLNARALRGILIRMGNIPTPGVRGKRTKLTTHVRVDDPGLL